MKILLSTASFHPEAGGPARSVPQLAEGLKELGHDVGLWAPDGSAVTSSLLSRSNGLSLLDGSAEEAWREFGRFDVVHDNGIWRGHHLLLARLARRSGMARVVSPRGMLEPWALDHKRVRKRLAWWSYQRRLLQAATTLHATAKSEANQFARLGLRSPVSILPNGVNLPDRKQLGRVREGSGDTKICLFMSRLHPKKGLPLLLEAWNNVRPSGWELQIAGPDESGHRRKLECMIRQLDLVRAVRFLGPLEGDEKLSALARADLMVLPTYSENFGIVVAEALAHGCPVITTHGAPWQTLEPNRCGWWVPVETAAIEKALRSATELSGAARREMGSRGRDLVVQRFAWPRIAQAFCGLYEEAIARHGARR